MYKNLLPIGSVVAVDGLESRLMICGRIQARAGESEIYDYSACLYPEGICGDGSVYFFNRGDVSEVVFRGFEDEEELSFRAEVLDKLEELEIRDGVIWSAL